MKARRTLLIASTALALFGGALQAQVVGTLRIDPTRELGTHPSGRLLVYSPDPLELGSSVSHWDPLASPDLLMEPSITPSLPFLGTDVTPEAMKDLGWQSGTSTIQIFPVQEPGEGFDDGRPFSGAPGNPAATLGQARLNLVVSVLGAWANTLESTVSIDVSVVWTEMFCSEQSGATLGAAGTTSIFRGPDLVGGAIDENTWVGAPLAEARLGENLTGDPSTDGLPDIVVFLNQAIDDECLGADTGFYYGLDDNSPVNQIALAPTILHELGHGLGFANFTDESAGTFIEGFPSVFDRLVRDEVLDMTWDELTDAQRVASATRARQLSWDGTGANQDAATRLDSGVPELLIQQPPEIAGIMEINTASFGPPFPATPLQGEIACMLDEAGAVGTNLDGCSPALNPEDLVGKIALVDRGGCLFSEKVANAQNAGATAVIIANNAGSSPPGLGGVDDTITIPTVGIGSSDGARLRAAACPTTANQFLGGRFQISAEWSTDDESAPAEAVGLTDESGYFYFFSPTNIEITVKMLDACSLPFLQGYWVFAAGMTDVGVELTVLDTKTGQSRTYSNPRGTTFLPIIDNTTFTGCL